MGESFRIAVARLGTTQHVERLEPTSHEGRHGSHGVKRGFALIMLGAAEYYLITMGAYLL